MSLYSTLLFGWVIMKVFQLGAVELLLLTMDAVLACLTDDEQRGEEEEIEEMRLSDDV